MNHCRCVRSTSLRSDLCQTVCLQRKWEYEEQGGKLQFRGRVHPQLGLDCRSRGVPPGLGLAGRGAAEAV